MVNKEPYKFNEDLSVTIKSPQKDTIKCTEISEANNRIILSILSDKSDKSNAISIRDSLVSLQIIDGNNTKRNKEIKRRDRKITPGKLSSLAFTEEKTAKDTHPKTSSLLQAVHKTIQSDSEETFKINESIKAD